MNALLALFIRSLRELLRSKLSYAALGTMIGIIFLFLLGASAGATATTAPGLKFFENSLFVVLVFGTLAGVSYFATAITEEKEEGTLGLLRMTDLDPLAILLGKSTSRLSAALLLLAATLPFTLLAVTLGGISARQVFASYLCLGAYLVLLANVALLISVLSPRGAWATGITAAVVIGTQSAAAALLRAPGWLAKLPIGSRVAFLAPVFTHAGEVLQTVNPFRRLGAVLTTGFAESVVDGQFWWSLALALLCLGVAWLVFDLATGDAPAWTTPRLVPRAGSRWETFAPGRTWLVSALAWKDYHFLYGGRGVLGAKWIGYGVLAVVFAAIGFGKRGLANSGNSVFWTMSCVLALELCLAGSRILRMELREQTLTSLAGLPLSMQHIVLMKLDGARRSLAPAFTWMCVGAALMIAGEVVRALTNTGMPGFSILPTGLGWLYFASQMWLLAHLAAHFSLKLKWGALPIAFTVLFVANLVGAMFCIGLFVMPIVALTYVSHLRTAIYQRLEQLAAED